MLVAALVGCLSVTSQVHSNTIMNINSIHIGIADVCGLNVIYTVSREYKLFIAGHYVIMPTTMTSIFFTSAEICIKVSI